MDLDDEQQRKMLDDLKNSHPDIYRDVTPLLNITTSDHFSDLFGFHAQQAFHVEWDFSHQIVDKYQITEELGRGGMGVVYSAYRNNGTFEQELAIKFIQPDFNNLLDKHALFEEAQLLARLNHPYIAKVFDGGEHEGTVYVVMEKVIGTTLNEFLYSTPLSPKEKLLLFSQICQALEHAHQNDVLHADLKPENILIDKQHCPKLIDFNLTQKVQNSRGRGIKELVAYSEHFASPEQKKGDYLTSLSDVYSLGKILHLLFPDLESKHDIACIQQKATQINLSKRYNSVEDLRHDIESVVSSQPITLKQQNPLYVLHCLLKRKPVPSFLLVLLILSGLLFSGLLIFKNHQLEQEKIVAENMMYEVTQLLFHSKGRDVSKVSINSMLELTRRRILSNPDLPTHIKQKMLLAMMTPIPTKHKVISENIEKEQQTL
ncbi:serine/threonine protein kinase [Aliivibrio sifiae]|nr:serine/threonine protein kinase [Aliivibrio sifiae]